MSALRTLRDGGPLAAVVAAAVGPGRAPDPLVATLAGALPLGVVLALPGGPPTPLLVAAVGWLVLAAGAAAPAPLDGPASWLVPALLRAVEYAALLRLAVLAGPAAVPACFALLGALAFHHYDLVYRAEQRRPAPPRRVRLAGGGWDGRLALAVLAAAGGAVRPAYVIGAVVLAALYLGESLKGWRRSAEGRPRLAAESEEM